MGACCCCNAPFEEKKVGALKRWVCLQNSKVGKVLQSL